MCDSVLNCTTFLNKMGVSALLTIMEISSKRPVSPDCISLLNFTSLLQLNLYKFKFNTIDHQNPDKVFSPTIIINSLE